MKKISKTIACLGLSLLTIGAMSQEQNKGIKIVPKSAMKTPQSLKIMGGLHSSGKKASPRAGSIGANINYVDGDITVGSYAAGTFVYWTPIDFINHYNTINDTGADVDGYPNVATVYTLNNVTVAFDTIYDAYSGGLYSATPGSVSLDTIWANIALHKTSSGPDTCIFWVNEVDQYGYPTGHVISADTIILDSTSLPFVGSMDSIYVIAIYNDPTIYPNAHLPLAIPQAEREGWNFCITADYRNLNKLDTLGVQYFSAATSCTNGPNTYGFCNSYTYMGVPGGYNQYLTYTGQPNTVNSWEAGLYYYNTAMYSGTGGQLTWPDTNYMGPFWGLEDNGTYYFFQAPCPGDTGVTNVEDIAISASISYIPTGINNITTADGFSIGQNYPNPYTKQTQIVYSLQKSSAVTFTVYDMTGREIMVQNYNTLAPGQYTINLSANKFSPGVYFYTFNVNGTLVTKKMVVTE